MRPQMIMRPVFFCGTCGIAKLGCYIMNYTGVSGVDKPPGWTYHECDKCSGAIGDFVHDRQKETERILEVGRTLAALMTWLLSTQAITVSRDQAADIDDFTKRRV